VAVKPAFCLIAFSCVIDAYCVYIIYRYHGASGLVAFTGCVVCTFMLISADYC